MEPLFWSQLQYTSVKLRDCILHSCDVFTATGSVHRFKVHMFGNVKATSMLSSGPHFARIIHQLFFHSFFCRCIQPVFIVVLCYAKIVVIKYIYASGLHLHSCFWGEKDRLASSLHMSQSSSSVIFLFWLWLLLKSYVSAQHFIKSTHPQTLTINKHDILYLTNPWQWPHLSYTNIIILLTIYLRNEQIIWEEESL